MEFKPLPDLLNNGFAITEIGLLYGIETLEAKNADFRPFLDNMAMFFEAEDAWKQFKYW